MARLVLEAAKASRLAPTSRLTMLQVTLDGLADLDGAEVEALRAALRKAMPQP